MTKEEAIKTIESAKRFAYDDIYEEAFDMAISALSEEDTTMEWIQHIDTKVDNSGKWRRKCSKCGYETNNFGYDKFCPNCGRKAVIK